MEALKASETLVTINSVTIRKTSICRQWINAVVASRNQFSVVQTVRSVTVLHFVKLMLIAFYLQAQL